METVQENQVEEVYAVLEQEIVMEEVDSNSDGNGDNSVEINLQNLKNFFINAVTLYEIIIRNSCTSCDTAHSEEFLNLYKSLQEFENIFKYFDVTYNRNLINNLVKLPQTRKGVNLIPFNARACPLPNSGVFSKRKKSNKELAESLINSDTLNRYTCYVISCNRVFGSEEAAKVHFIKNHCVRGNVFESVVQDMENLEGFEIDINAFPIDPQGNYRCQECVYQSADRSNFRVHLLRHKGLKKFVCPVCNKTFYTRDPLMIHYVRLHMKDIDWENETKDLRKLRKTVRRLTNKENLKYTSNDEMPDDITDQHGPIQEEENILHQYVTNAFVEKNSTETDKEDTSNVVDVRRGNSENNANGKNEASGSQIEEEESANAFKVSLSLRDVDFFSDSVTLNSEGVTTDINALIRNKKTNEVQNSERLFTTKMTMNNTKDAVVKKNIPQRSKKFKCPHDFCQQSFFTMKNLLIHLKASHDPENPIECPQPNCQARFKSPALLAQHQKRHQVQYSCSLCTYTTHLAALMTRHNRQHAGKQLHHQCELCDEKFEYLGALNSHCKKVHQQKNALCCTFPNCQKRFKTIIGLNKHRRELHMKMKPEITCDWPECSASFTNRTSMTNHRRIHTNERPYQCDWPDCGKWFRLKETLKRHCKVHQGSNPHVCPFDRCDKCFATLRSMKIHIDRVHLKNNQKNQEESITDEAVVEQAI